MSQPKIIRVAIFASGSGTNAINIFNYFKRNENIEISILFTNKDTAGVIDKFMELDISILKFEKRELNNIQFLNRLENIDFIVLAGFLLLIPNFIIEKFSNRIINIHPSLLPDYGGKNMYGDKIHEAVIAAKEKYSGITIHLVDREYDKGAILFQEKVLICIEDTPISLANKIHQLEYNWYPFIIEKTIREIFIC